MAIVQDVQKLLQEMMADAMDQLAKETGCVKRVREFTGSTLLSSLVLTVMQNPDPKLSDYQTTASQLNVHVTEEAIAQRFTPELVKFLEPALNRIISHVLTVEAPPVELLDRFAQVVIADSTTVPLPDEYAEQFPGCGGTNESGKAAMKVQVRWDLRHGTMHMMLEPGSASDSKSPINEVPLPTGSLIIRDLGYFSIERFEHIQQGGSFWLSRLQPGTVVYDEEGNRVQLRDFLAKHENQGIVDVRVQIGAKRLACRLVAMRVPPEVAARRRQKAIEKARDHGRTASQEHLELMEWTIFVTNCDEKLLTWKEVVVLYRARWQVERLFKLWKSYNRLESAKPQSQAVRQLAEVYIRLIAVIIQHGMLLMTVWLDSKRSLWRAAVKLRSWIGALIANIDDPVELQQTLERLQRSMTKSTRTNQRRKHPSCFQLLNTPELLDYTVA